MTTSHRSSIVTAVFSLFLAASLAAGCDVAAPEQEAPVEQITQAVLANPSASLPVATSKAVEWNKVGGAVTTSAVKDPVHCPERLPGNGEGDLVGGMCLYPVPVGGCSTLGSDCDTTHDIEPMCRCEQKNNLSGGPGGGPAEVLTAS
jgi:hypothetical protein